MSEPAPQPTVRSPAVHHDPLTIHHALRTAIAAGLAYWLTTLLHLPAGYWAVVSAIVVMQSEVGSTVIASRDRLVGTAIGCFIGFLTALVWHHSIVVFALAILIVMVTCTALRLQNAGRLGGIAVVIVVLVPHTQPVSHIALERFLEVSFGILVSLALMETWSAVSRRFTPKK